MVSGEHTIDDGSRYGTPITIAEERGKFHVISDFNDHWFKYDGQGWVYLPDGWGTTCDREILLDDRHWWDPESGDEAPEEPFPLGLKHALEYERTQP